MTDKDTPRTIVEDGIELVFENPPASRGRGPGFWTAWLEAVSRHPGQWIKHPKLHNNPSMTAMHVKRLASHMDGEFEVVSRGDMTVEVGANKCRPGYVYARCLKTAPRSAKNATKTAGKK